MGRVARPHPSSAIPFDFSPLRIRARSFVSERRFPITGRATFLAPGATADTLECVNFRFVSSPPVAAAGASPTTLWGDGLALLAGMAWAATTLVVRCSRLARVSATETLLYQLVVGFVLLLAAAVGLGQTAIRPTPLLWGSLLFQSLVVAFASYLAWFWLLRHYWASRLGVFSFLTPLFGIAFGVGLLDEPVEASFLVGAILVLAGVVLVSGDDGWNALRGRLVRPGDNARAVAPRGDVPNAGYPVAATDCLSSRTHPRAASQRRSAGRNRWPSSE